MTTTTRTINSIELKIAAQQEKLAQLKTQKLRLEAMQKTRDTKAVRAADTRRKILLGAYLADEMQRDAQLDADIRKQLDKWLTRPDDRGLFGLPVMTAQQVEE
ncbi:MAG TPA: mobilization protein [Burkholderiaceae bacterium]|jgi:uncharacterized protein (DUF2336 family)